MQTHPLICKGLLVSRAMQVLLAFVLCLAVGATGCGGDDSHVDSPHGSVPFGDRAFSPDGTKYAREIAPANTGMIGVFNRANDALLVSFDAWLPSSPNDLKGLAWHPNSALLAVMYHAGGSSIITVHNALTGERLKELTLEGFYHAMAFRDDGRIRLEADNLDEKVVDVGFPR